MALPKGFVTLHDTSKSGMLTAEIAGVTNLSIRTQAELDALHRLVAEGKPLPLKPAPGQKPPRARSV